MTVFQPSSAPMSSASAQSVSQRCPGAAVRGRSAVARRSGEPQASATARRPLGARAGSDFKAGAGYFTRRSACRAPMTGTA